MSLKDEIDKLIAAERETLAKRDIEDRNYHEQQKALFLPLRAVLEEMTKAVDPAYLEVGLENTQATIKVGEYTKGNRFVVNIQWFISCGPDESPDGEELEQWVFSMAETTISSYSKEHIFERYKFETVEEVVQHLVKKWPNRLPCTSMLRNPAVSGTAKTARRQALSVLTTAPASTARDSAFPSPSP